MGIDPPRGIILLCRCQHPLTESGQMTVLTTPAGSTAYFRNPAFLLLLHFHFNHTLALTLPFQLSTHQVSRTNLHRSRVPLTTTLVVVVGKIELMLLEGS
ncbi:hypothetical protein Lser_V15G38848 [Lactuca serriola]